jgi:hypothetical protein
MLIKTLLRMFSRILGTLISLPTFYSQFRGYRRALPAYTAAIRNGKEPLILDHGISPKSCPLRRSYEICKGKTLTAASMLLLLVQGNPIAARFLVWEYLTEHLRRKSCIWRQLREYFVNVYSQLAEIETLAKSQRKILRDFADDLRGL